MSQDSSTAITKPTPVQPEVRPTAQTTISAASTMRPASQSRCQKNHRAENQKAGHTKASGTSLARSRASGSPGSTSSGTCRV